MLLFVVMNFQELVNSHLVDVIQCSLICAKHDGIEIVSAADLKLALQLTILMKVY